MSSVPGWNIVALIDRIKCHTAFLVIAALFGLVTLSITPPFQVPDEHNHFLRAYQVSELNLVSERIQVNESAGVTPYEYVTHVARLDKTMASGGYLPLSLAMTFEKGPKGVEVDPDSRYDIRKTGMLRRIPLNPQLRTFYSFGNMAVYSPVPYIPQAAGIAIGRMLNLSPIVLMYLGRVANLTAWLVLVFFAIRQTPSGKQIFLLLALLPMSLYQAASLSADAVTNGASFLLTALILKTAFQVQKPVIIEYAALLLLGLTVALSKMAYLPLVWLVLLIPIRRDDNCRTALSAVSAIIGICTLTAVAWVKKAGSLYTSFIEGSSAPDQLQFILHNPLKFLYMIFNTIKIRGVDTVEQFIGVLGWLDTPLPGLYYLLVVLVAAAIVLSSEEPDIRFRAAESTLLLLSLAGSAVLVITSVYLYWTPVGLDKVAIQGRYFIPLGPALLLLISGRFKQIRIPQLKAVLYALSLLSACCMFAAILRRYYS